MTELQPLSEALISRTVEFCRLLKISGLNATPGRVTDAFRALGLAGIGDRDSFRLALRTNFVSSREEERLFDRLFEAFFNPDSRVEGASPPPAIEPPVARGASEASGGPPASDGSAQSYSRQEVWREKKLPHRWPGDSPELQRLWRQALRRLATRPSRRLRSARKGPRIDLKGSLRRNLRYGMELVALARLRRRVRKLRLVLLCDVSGSMDTYNPFLLQLLWMLHRSVRSCRTAVFSTRVTEVTAAMRRRSPREVFDNVARLARHWSGGTDLGGALASLNCGMIREGGAGSTVAIIISDGYDQGDPALVGREMRALRRRVRSVVWINPLLGSEGYAPLAKGMRAALPYVDYFLPAHEVPTLRTLSRATTSRARRDRPAN